MVLQDTQDLGWDLNVVMYLTGMSNIRGVVPFPRTVNNSRIYKRKNGAWEK